MTELSFAKSFLTTLDSRPSKLSADHVEDPRRYPARSAYILPKALKPLARRTPLAPGAERTLSVSLKSLRNPPLDVTLPAQALSTSILSLKTSLSSQTTIPVAKIKLLHNKKPVPDSKILKDLASDGDSKVEFSVMVIGGAASLKAGKGPEEVEPEVEREVKVNDGDRVLHTEHFWTDLKAFLVQRLKDEREGEMVHGIFRRAVEAEGKIG